MSFSVKSTFIDILCSPAESTMELILKALLLGVAVIAAVLLFSPYEAFLEGSIAFVIVAAVIVGFLMYPRKEMFYVRTAIRLIRQSETEL